jgi:hypothetical protein
MPIVGRAKDPEVFRIVGAAEGEWFDAIDLEIVGAVAFVA